MPRTWLKRLCNYLGEKSRRTQRSMGLHLETLEGRVVPADWTLLVSVRPTAFLTDVV